MLQVAAFAGAIRAGRRPGGRCSWRAGAAQGFSHLSTVNVLIIGVSRPLPLW